MTAITISLRVMAPGPAAARVSAGRRQFSIGRPVEFHDASPHVAAFKYALGAVGGEVVNGLREFARLRRLAIATRSPARSSTKRSSVCRWSPRCAGPSISRSNSSRRRKEDSRCIG